jgi:hypothetical protein
MSPDLRRFLWAMAFFLACLAFIASILFIGLYR